MNKKILTTLGIEGQKHNYFMRNQNEVCQNMMQEWSCVRVILRVCGEKNSKKMRQESCDLCSSYTWVCF